MVRISRTEVAPIQLRYSREKQPNQRDANVAYKQDFAKSARRHYRAATELEQTSSAGAQPGCGAVAGYLFGLAGELAVKELMRTSGIPPLPRERRRDDPYFSHFPEIKALLLDQVRGRRAGELRLIAESNTLYQHWDTDMRYAPTEDIQPSWVLSWRASAKALIEKMGMP